MLKLSNTVQILSCSYCHHTATHLSHHVGRPVVALALCTSMLTWYSKTYTHTTLRHAHTHSTHNLTGQCFRANRQCFAAPMFRLCESWRRHNLFCCVNTSSPALPWLWAQTLPKTTMRATKDKDDDDDSMKSTTAMVPVFMDNKPGTASTDARVQGRSE